MEQKEKKLKGNILSSITPLSIQNIYGCTFSSLIGTFLYGIDVDTQGFHDRKKMLIFIVDPIWF